MANNTLPFGAGTGPYGAMPFGTSGAIEQAINRALAIAENRIRLIFDIAPYYANIQVQNDAHDIEHYSIEGQGVDRVGEATRRVLVAAAVQVDEFTIDLLLDRPMSSFPATYTLVIDGLKSASGDAPFETQTKQFFGIFKGIPEPTTQLLLNNRDIANPSNADEGWSIDDRGDLGFDQGMVSYKKRVTRRLITRRDAFAHLKNYGTHIMERVKQLDSPAVRDASAVEAEEQIRQEPETISVTVNVRETNSPGLYVMQIKAKTTIGDAEFDVPTY